MKTVIKTTLKGSEAITIAQSVPEVYEALVDKGGFCMFDRITGGG